MADDTHPLVRLAVEAIRAFVLEQRILDPPRGLFDEVPVAERAAGAFVSLKKQGVLRGCIGTTTPTRLSLASEVIHSAIGAATRDPRFPPVQECELGELQVSVDVLGTPEPVLHLSELDHRLYGVMVSSGARQAVLLPDIEGVTSVEEQLSVVRSKAGLQSDEEVTVFRFQVVRYR